jgi:septal ring factor EnvC (AmiA/AmiB activator)
MRISSLLFSMVLGLSIGLSITATVAVSAEQTTDPAELERKLQELESNIKKFKAMLDETRDQKSAIESNLETNEKRINDLLKKIQTIETELEKGENKIGRLSEEQKELKVAKSEQQEYIGRQIRAAYQIGNQEYLKVLLNQEDPNQISRMLTYYDYFNRARASQIESYNETIVQLRNIANLIETENTTLEENRNRFQIEQKEVIKVQTQKRKILVMLNREISTTGKALDKKIGDRDQLEQLMERIQAGINNLPGPKDLVPFETLKGQLLLPVAGRISHRYGNTRIAGKLKWSGVMIDAPEGEPVQAVHYGRVVFSDWLRGFGLLLIINHGEGYMSLYGHNQVLYRETGEWVTAGETIATVGDTGGQNRSGLYFEIRVAGKTADPQLWCRVRSKRAA